MKVKISLSLLVLYTSLLMEGAFLTLANATISKEQCGNADYSERMGPVRTQGNSGTCWSFAAAALLEEVYYKKLKSEGTAVDWKKDALSPLDVTRCKWNIGYKEQGFYVPEALKCIAGSPDLGRGICPESYAPFPKQDSCTTIVTKEVQSTHEKWIGTTFISCGMKALSNFYSHRESYCEGCKDTNSAHACKQLIESNPDLRFIIQVLSQATRLDYNVQQQERSPFLSMNPSMNPSEQVCELCKKSEVAGNSGRFYGSVYLEPQCAKNRILSRQSDFNKDQIHSEFIASFSRSERLDKIKGVLTQSDASVSVGLCVAGTADQMIENSLQGKSIPFLNSYDKYCDGKHAVVINGIRWNAEANKCEVHIKNSWGESAQFNGWLLAEEVMDSVGEMTYISK